MRRVALLVLALAVLGAGGAVALRLLASPSTDEDAIRALFRDAAQAVADRRVDDAMDAVSERFAGSGLDRRGLQRLVLGHVLRGAWVSVHVAADRVQVAGDAAEAVLLAIAARSSTGTAVAEILPSSATALRIACRLVREGGTWRVVAAEWHEIGVEEARGVAGAEWFAPRAR